MQFECKNTRLMLTTERLVVRVVQCTSGLAGARKSEASQVGLNGKMPERSYRWRHARTYAQEIIASCNFSKKNNFRVNVKLEEYFQFQLCKF